MMDDRGQSPPIPIPITTRQKINTPTIDLPGEAEDRD
jgi:hypothetical protein